ncbi:hypothetical protein FRC12_008022 [Ceratobasidium sp. 428]|nr:hypothetical protein FRC12_008022 [Ceratobasidium sp. 428]
MPSPKFPPKFSLRSVLLSEATSPGFNPGPSGMYATVKNGLNKPLVVSAQIPGVLDFQKWRFTTPIESESCQILFVPSGPHTEPSAGFATVFKSLETPITMSLTPSYYHIRLQGHTGNGLPIVTIHPVGDFTSLDCSVGVSEENNLQIQGFPAGGTEEGRLGWIVYT